MSSRLKLQKKWRHKLTSLVALFFVVYALADVSILQVYCGNEAVGIPPLHHSAAQADHIISGEQHTCSAFADSDCKQIPDDHEYDHQHECFCSQHAVVGFYFLGPSTASVFVNSGPPVFYESTHSISSLTHLFRPPQTS